MSEIDTEIRIIAGILVGASLYVVMNWIPLLGPFIVGFSAGRISRGRGFLTGFLSGVFGFAFLLLFVFPRWGISGNVFLMWILLLWNILGMILAGMGGSFGSAARMHYSFSRRVSVPEKGKREEPADILLVCPRCGNSNPDGSVRCKSCGGEL